MSENVKVALGLLGYLVLVCLITFAQVTGVLFDASNVSDHLSIICGWLVVVASWIALFMMLWVFVTRNLNQPSLK